jgi:periplasmic protein TonB
MQKTALVIYGVSIGVHAMFAVGAGAISLGTQIESVAVELTESGKPQEKKPENRDEPDEPKAVVARPAAARRALPSAPAPKATAAETTNVGNGDALDFGVSLSGTGDGPGLNVGRAGNGTPTTNTAAKAPTAPVTKVLAPATSADACEEPLVKARPKGVPQPSYTEAARSASIEGKVRVRVNIDETGRVASVELVSGLGYGLDEAALASARAARFDPATRCGKPVASSFVIAMRFVL